MKLSKQVLILVFLYASLASISEAKREQLQRRSRTVRSEGSGSDNITVYGDSQTAQNEIEDRIVVGEPYKSLLQTTARFALAQTKLPNHVNIDTAMNLLNDAGFILARPTTLFKVVKIVAVSIASFLATTFFFPGSYRFLEATWRDPYNTLNLDRYLSNGLREKSVLSILGSKTDEALSRVGLQDNSCRELSLCYMGEILRCSFPQTAETITKFASENFSNTGIRDNTFSRSFISGFVDRNCTKLVTESAESPSCLGNFFNSILVSPRQTKKQR